MGGRRSCVDSVHDGAVPRLVDPRVEPADVRQIRVADVRVVVVRRERLEKGLDPNTGLPPGADEPKPVAGPAPGEVPGESDPSPELSPRRRRSPRRSRRSSGTWPAASRPRRASRA
mgnify:CR=1 FL=1